MFNIKQLNFYILNYKIFQICMHEMSNLWYTVKNCIVKSSPPEEFTITYIGVSSFQLKWNSPKDSHATIDHYIVSCYT